MMTISIKMTVEKNYKKLLPGVYFAGIILGYGVIIHV